MTWNYRVVRHPDGTLALHEAYYDDAGRLKAATAGPISFVADPDEGLDGIVRSVLWLMRTWFGGLISSDDMPPTVIMLP